MSGEGQWPVGSGQWQRDPLLIPERAASLAEVPVGAPAGAPEDGGASGWAVVRVVLAAVLVAVALRALVFDAYRIPSESMEDTLLVGDFVFVSKLTYGPLVLGRRLPGTGAPRRGDVAVFHYPPGLEARVEARTPYIKRLVGMPGDTVLIRQKRLVVGGRPVPPPARGRRFWQIATGGTAPRREALRAAGVDAEPQRLGPGLWVLDARADQAERLAGVAGVVSVAPYLRPPADGSAAFPVSRRYTLDDYGPVVVPSAGMTVALTDRAVGLYRLAIERDEGHRVERGAAGVLVDGAPAEAFTFSQDYYFALGDHRDDSADSRTWGFVPHRNLIGRAARVYFSWDAEAGRVRWHRIGMAVR